MVFGFARVSATVHMEVGDYYQSGKRWWIRLHEKGGKRHEVPCQHNLELYIDEYMAVAGIGDQKRSPLFRSVDKHRGLTDRAISRTDVLRMIKRRVIDAGLPEYSCCHTSASTATAYFARTRRPTAFYCCHYLKNDIDYIGTRWNL